MSEFTGLGLLLFAIFSMFALATIDQVDFTNDVISFEHRCNYKGGLTLQAYKDGQAWIGCYKDGKELENEK